MATLKCIHETCNVNELLFWKFIYLLIQTLSLIILQRKHKKDFLKCLSL